MNSSHEASNGKQGGEAKARSLHRDGGGDRRRWGSVACTSALGLQAGAGDEEEEPGITSILTFMLPAQ